MMAHSKAAPTGVTLARDKAQPRARVSRVIVSPHLKGRHSCPALSLLQGRGPGSWALQQVPPPQGRVEQSASQGEDRQRSHTP